jgi:hypothetical protein
MKEKPLAEAIANIPMPDRIRRLPISDKGFPIPAFVAWLDIEGKRYLPPGTFGATRDFRVIDPTYLAQCFRWSQCWICNELLGTHRVFAIGPMCAVSRTTMEPPSHRDCVEYAARACPFLVNPRTRRNKKGLPDDVSAPGLMIERNPGVTALWETPTYKRWRAPSGLLCTVGDPIRVDWWAQGRPATRAEVIESIDSGFPILLQDAEKEGPEAIAELNKRRAFVDRFLPP